MLIVIAYFTGESSLATLKVKSSERQMIAMLFFVTIALLLLTLPMYARLIVASSVDYNSSPEAYASFFLLIHVSNKLFVTNNCINFFMYVISGTKFRNDLKFLFGKGLAAVGYNSSAGTSST